MSDLNSEDLLEALRQEATEPAARERVRARLVAAGAVGATTAVASLAAAQSPTWLVKLGMLGIGKLLAVSAGVVAVGTVAVLATSEPAPAPKPARTVASRAPVVHKVEPVVAPLPAPPPETAEPVPSQRVARAKTPSKVNLVAEPPAPPASTLADESALLGSAVHALLAGDHERARALLEEHAQRFPDGMLARERQRALSRLDAAHAP